MSKCEVCKISPAKYCVTFPTFSDKVEQSVLSRSAEILTSTKKNYKRRISGSVIVPPLKFCNDDDEPNTSNSLPPMIIPQRSPRSRTNSSPSVKSASPLSSGGTFPRYMGKKSVELPAGQTLLLESIVHDTESSLVSPRVFHTYRRRKAPEWSVDDMEHMVPEQGLPRQDLPRQGLSPASGCLPEQGLPPSPRMFPRYILRKSPETPTVKAEPVKQDTKSAQNTDQSPKNRLTSRKLLSVINISPRMDIFNFIKTAPKDSPINEDSTLSKNSPLNKEEGVAMPQSGERYLCFNCYNKYCGDLS